MFFQTPTISAKTILNVALATSFLLLISLTTRTDAQDIDLVSKRLNKMVTKDQLTQPQADAMLATLKAMVAKPTITLPMLRQVEHEATPELNPSVPVEFKLQVAQEKIEQFNQVIREQRIQLQVHLKSLRKKSEQIAFQQIKLQSDLGKLKEMLNEARATGSINRNGKEISQEQLKTLAETTVQKVASLVRLSDRNKELISVKQASLNAIVAEEQVIAKKMPELKARYDQLQAIQLIEESKSQKQEIEDTIRELNDALEKEIDSLKKPSSQDKGNY